MGGATKQVRLYQSWMDCWPLGRLPLHTRLERWDVPVLSVDVAIDTEKGIPACSVRMLESCQPPRTLSTTRFEFARNCRPWPTGTWNTVLSVSLSDVEIREAVVGAQILRILNVDPRFVVTCGQSRLKSSLPHLLDL